jgi:DNA gyrase/topoisomerase IV subunit B
MTYSTQAFNVLEGLDAVRFRPAMYIGPGDADHSLCLRSGGVFTVAFDGEPLPIAPYAPLATGVAHPEPYWLFMCLAVGGSRSGLGGAIVNALSERLVVSTVHSGVRYRAAFRRGGLIGLLGRTGQTDEALGTNWITFKPDETVVPGAVTFEDAERLIGQLAARAPNVELSAIDRTQEKPDWW